MKLILVCALALSGCAMERVIDLRPGVVACLQEGKLLAAVKIDAEGKIVKAQCLPVRLAPDHES